MKVDSIASPAVNDGPVVWKRPEWWLCSATEARSELQCQRYAFRRICSRVLVCPVCKEPVLLTQNGTGLKCGKCLRVYPIQDDIPIMLIDAATVDPH